MNTNEQNTAPKLLSERLLRYSNELSGPSSGELVALLREAATAICDLSHDAALVRQSVEHGWAAAALAPPSGEGVGKGPWHVTQFGTIQSDDFTVDAQLQLSGDFKDAVHRRQYAEWLCSKLNTTPQSAPEE